MNNKQDKGFTLVELLIVIVILGILATVTVFAVRGITDRGQENACSVDQRTLDTAIEAFYAQYQTDPTVVTNLTAGYDPDGAGPLATEGPFSRTPRQLHVRRSGRTPYDGVTPTTAAFAADH